MCVVKETDQDAQYGKWFRKAMVPEGQTASQLNVYSRMKTSENTMFPLYSVLPR